MRNILQEYCVYSQYFAPRGKERLLFLGEQLSHRHLNFTDRLIGIVGDAGSGKSSLIKGMFPGLELCNDDDTLNPRKIMQVRDMIDGVHDCTTYHIDMRFQTAFTQMHEIVDFVNRVIESKRRVIIEHFNLLYPALQKNADIMIGIGEEIVVTRPNVFGPLPDNIYDIVHTSLKYRKMAHTVEDITIMVLIEDYGISSELFYSSDVRKGFVLRFRKKIDLDFNDLTCRVRQKIMDSLPVAYYDESHIKIGDSLLKCNGPRLHLRNTSDVENFELIDHFVKDDNTGTYCLVGLLGVRGEDIDIENLNKLYYPVR